jgi:hypothetical protein
MLCCETERHNADGMLETLPDETSDIETYGWGE